MDNVNKTATVIVGGGIAGAATAYFLAQQGSSNIIIIEKDQIAGVHSTGRNAAILRTLIPEYLLRHLAREAAEFYRHPPDGFSANPLVDLVGICLVARNEYSGLLLACLGNGQEKGSPKQVAPEKVYERIPQLAPGLTAAWIKRMKESLTSMQFFRLFCAAQAGMEWNSEHPAKP